MQTANKPQSSNTALKHQSPRGDHGSRRRVMVSPEAFNKPNQEKTMTSNIERMNIQLIRSPDAIAIGLDQHIVRHSPTGIEWGYGGSGPADLALSILTQYAGQEFADRHYQQFKFDVIASIPREGGTITVEKIEQWIDKVKA